MTSEPEWARPRLVRPVTWLQWQQALDLHQSPEDKFAHTFKAKADAMDLWPNVVGIFDGDENVMAAIAVRLNKRQPVANLQLLHTFSEHRRKGLAKLLVENEFDRCLGTANYFRVSAEEDALPFYRSLDFLFWGRQKSGTYLSMFRLHGDAIWNGIYDQDDPVIKAALFSGRRGCITEPLEGGPC